MDKDTTSKDTASQSTTSQNTTQQKQSGLAVILVIIAFVAFVSCAVSSSGSGGSSNKDTVERVSSGLGFKCEVCAGYGVKKAATYHVVKGGRDYYVCSSHLSAYQ